MDSYQAFYDAARSRITNADVGAAIERVARDSFDTSFLQSHAQQELYRVGAELTRPSVLYRPELMVDGTAWCALLGENLMVGVAGFGDTPDEAMRAFDAEFVKAKTPAAMVAARKAAPVQ